ncbi:MAG: hypothetical protein AAGU75_25275, partial [Bacillota bacterium]
ISTHGTRRDNLADPETSATSFVLDNIKQVVEERLLPVHGQLTSMDILFSFVDRYYHLLNLSPEKDSFEVSELNTALNQHMLGVCASIASSLSRSESSIVSINLDFAESYIQSNEVEPVPPSSVSTYYSISSHYIPIRSVFDALRNVVDTDIKIIKRPFIRQDPELQAAGGWVVWSGYKPEDEICNVNLMLKNAIPEYSKFIQRNRLKLPESRYLDKSTSIIMEYRPTFISDGVKPLLHIDYLCNQSQSLPKFAVLISSDEKWSIDRSTFPEVNYNGVKYESIKSTESTADFLFSSTPMLNLLYRLLTNDLSEHYDISFFSSRYYS